MMKVFKEPINIIYDIFYFTYTSVKKPKSYLFNFIINYQKIRIYLDKYLIEKYQKKFLDLELSEEKKVKLKKLKNDGVLKIENFFDFQNTEEIISLLNNKEENKEKLQLIVNQNKDKISKKIIYFLSFLRGENFDYNQLILSFEVHADKNLNDEFHSDIWAHSPKAYIYLNDINFQERPFLYLLKSHKDYESRIALENISSKDWYLGKNKFSTNSPRLRENDNWEKYFSKFEKFTGIAKKGDLILADTSGFHAKGPGDKPRYTFWIETSRDNIVKKILSIFLLKKYLTKIIR